jgi:hypothetical protein
MELTQFQRRQSFGNERPRAPRALLYVPPSGSPVSCPDLESAQAAAENYAAENPGRTAAVYQLVGYAFRPVEKPEFTPADSDQAKDELLDVAPSGSDLGNPDGGHAVERPDLTPAQRETWQNMRRAMSRESDKPEGE